MPKLPAPVLMISTMTLRDYFAAQSLATAFDDGVLDLDVEIFARRAYQLADAMLRERDEEDDRR
jgi:hypothetical protein